MENLTGIAKQLGYLQHIGYVTRLGEYSLEVLVTSRDDGFEGASSWLMMSRDEG